MSRSVRICANNPNQQWRWRNPDFSGWKGTQSTIIKSFALILSKSPQNPARARHYHLGLAAAWGVQKYRGVYIPATEKMLHRFFIWLGLGKYQHQPDSLVATEERSCNNDRCLGQDNLK